jgi:hypothetical protein
MLFASTEPPGCRPLRRLRPVFYVGETEKNSPPVWGEPKTDRALGEKVKPEKAGKFLMAA